MLRFSNRGRSYQHDYHDPYHTLPNIQRVCQHFYDLVQQNFKDHGDSVITDGKYTMIPRYRHCIGTVSYCPDRDTLHIQSFYGYQEMKGIILPLPNKEKFKNLMVQGAVNWMEIIKGWVPAGAGIPPLTLLFPNLERIQVCYQDESAVPCNHIEENEKFCMPLPADALYFSSWPQAGQWPGRKEIHRHRITNFITECESGKWNNHIIAPALKHCQASGDWSSFIVLQPLRHHITNEERVVEFIPKLKQKGLPKVTKSA